MHDKKKPRAREVNRTIYSPWISRDGKTVIYADEQMVKLARLWASRRRPSRPTVPVRLVRVHVQDGRLVFKLPERPEVPPFRFQLPRDVIPPEEPPEAKE